MKNGFDTGQRVQMRSDQISEGYLENRMRIGKEERKTENQPQLPEHEARQDRTKKRDDEIEDASEDAPPVPRAIYHSIYIQSSQGARLPALETRCPLQCKANPCFQPIFQSQRLNYCTVGHH